MKKLKVMTVVGTRPEIIRLSRVLAALDEHTEHILVHTGQNYDYELNQVFFEDLGVRKPDHFLNSAGSNAAQTIGNLIIAVDKVLEEEKPEELLVLGDTNSCLAVIITWSEALRPPLRPPMPSATRPSMQPLARGCSIRST
jgi:UDP-N-acetylglucosamine 2-epimerase (non-hydrolysing)